MWLIFGIIALITLVWHYTLLNHLEFLVVFDIISQSNLQKPGAANGADNYKYCFGMFLSFTPTLIVSSQN